MANPLHDNPRSKKTQAEEAEESIKRISRGKRWGEGHGGLPVLGITRDVAKGAARCMLRSRAGRVSLGPFTSTA